MAAGVRGPHQRPRLVGSDPEKEPKVRKKAPASRKHAEMYIAEPGPFRRWWARVLDGLITLLSVLLLMWLSGSSITATTIDESSGIESATTDWFFIAGFWFLAFLYEAGFVYLFGGTPGKLMTGTRVVSPKSGGNIGLVRSLLRALGVMISQLFALLWVISGVMVFVAPQRRTLHDYLAGSVVSFEIE